MHLRIEQLLSVTVFISMAGCAGSHRDNGRSAERAQPDMAHSILEHLHPKMRRAQVAEVIGEREKESVRSYTSGLVIDFVFLKDGSVLAVDYFPAKDSRGQTTIPGDPNDRVFKVEIPKRK